MCLPDFLSGYEGVLTCCGLSRTVLGGSGDDDDTTSADDKKLRGALAGELCPLHPGSTAELLMQVNRCYLKREAKHSMGGRCWSRGCQRGS